MSGRYGRYVAALGGLILALAVVGPSASTQQAHPTYEAANPRAQAPTPPLRTIYKPNCDAPEKPEDGQYCEQRKATVAAQDQAEWAKRQAIVGGLGVVFVVLTLLYTVRAANAAKRAAEAIPILERAYIYSEVTGHSIDDAMHSALNALASSGMSDIPAVGLRLKNFGKTPATVTRGEIVFTYVGGGPLAADVEPWPAEYQCTLAEGEMTGPHGWKLPFPLTAQHVRAIKSGMGTLRLSGWAFYIDIWGRQRQCDIGWTYNPRLERLVPDDPKSKEQRRKEVTRSRHWFGRLLTRAEGAWRGKRQGS